MTAQPPSSLTLERFVLGELPHEERLALEAALLTDRALLLRVETMRASTSQILEHHPGRLASTVVHHRAGQTPRGGGPRPAPVLLTALGAVVLAMALRGVAMVRDPGGALPPETLQSKGPAAALRVFRKTPNGSEPLLPGSRAFKGDLLRVGYQATAGRYGVIVSVDGRNNVTRHWPSHGELAVPLREGGLVLLDDAFELDDAPRFERFYLVTSEHAFAIDTLVEALRDAGPASPVRSLAALPGLELVSLEVQKEASR